MEFTELLEDDLSELKIKTLSLVSALRKEFPKVIIASRKQDYNWSLYVDAKIPIERDVSDLRQLMSYRTTIKVYGYDDNKYLYDLTKHSVDYIVENIKSCITELSNQPT